MSDDEELWRQEADAVIADVHHHVDQIYVSSVLPQSRKTIFLNLATLEKRRYCVELTAFGFKIVGEQFDVNNLEGNQVFETPYSLLESVSPRYRESFGEQLVEKLIILQQENPESNK